MLAGHSLGAGTAALLTLMLRESFPTPHGPLSKSLGIPEAMIICWGFGCPPCVDLSLAVTSPFIYNAVLQVCHLSPQFFCSACRLTLFHTHNFYSPPPSLKILFFHIWGFETLFRNIILCQGESKIILMCDINDQNTEVCVCIQGHPCFVFEPESSIK